MVLPGEHPGRSFCFGPLPPPLSLLGRAGGDRLVGQKDAPASGMRVRLLAGVYALVAGELVDGELARVLKGSAGMEVARSGVSSVHSDYS